MAWTQLSLDIQILNILKLVLPFLLFLLTEKTIFDSKNEAMSEKFPCIAQSHAVWPSLFSSYRGIPLTTSSCMNKQYRFTTICIIVSHKVGDGLVMIPLNMAVDLPCRETPLYHRAGIIYCQKFTKKNLKDTNNKVNTTVGVYRCLQCLPLKAEFLSHKTF